MFRTRLFWLLKASLTVVVLGSGCGTLRQSSDSDKAEYFDAAYSDRNRAPAAMTPPKNAGQSSDRIDQVYMQTQADYNFALGETLSLEGNHKKAIEAFRMVSVYDPNSSHVPLRIAGEFVKLGMMSQAVEYAETSVQKNPKYIEARLLLGGLYSSLKSYDKAVEQYQSVLKIEPKNLDAPMYLGAIHAEKKQYDRAIKFFESLANNDDNQLPHLPYYYIGRIRTEQGGVKHLRDAEQAFNKALKLKKDHVDSALALAVLYSKLKMEDKAYAMLRNFQREHGPSSRVAEVLSQKYLENEEYDLAYDQLEILEADGDDTLNIKVKMALILIEKKKYDLAVSKLNEIIRLAPESDKIRFYLAAVYEEMGVADRAIENFQKIGPDSQYYGESVVHAAFLLKQEKKTDQAIEVVKKAISLRKDLPQIYAIYASLLDEKGEYKVAINSLTEALTKFPEHVQLQFYMGTMHDRIGDKKSVIEYMKKVIQLDPNHVQGLNYLAYTYSELSTNLDEAEGLIKRALKLDPHDGYILDTYGWILYQQGKLQDSIKILETAYKAQPSESIIAEHLGDVYFKLHMIERAKTMYKKAAEVETDENRSKTIRTKITATEEQQPVKEVQRLPASTQSSPNQK